MKLKTFRIYHYKSIVDSGECPVAADFTTLIGKNESGKTAILEALRDFDRDVAIISQQAFPVSGTNVSPKIELTFDVSEKELDSIIDESGQAIDTQTRRLILQQGISVTKSATGEYRVIIQPKTIKAPTALVETNTSFGQEIDQQIQKLGRLIETTLRVSAISSLEAREQRITDLRRLVRRRIDFIRDDAQKKEAVEALHELVRMLQNYQPQTQTPAPVAPTAAAEDQSKIISIEPLMLAIFKRLPHFIYFSDFKDVLPFEISIEDLKTVRSLRDLAFLGDEELDSILAMDDMQKRINLLNRYSAKISANFLGHWQQESIEIIIRPEGDKLIFGIKEKDGTDVYKMDQRSKGLQWFLSFYMKLNRLGNDAAILLIDEPGTNLHPAAQRDILGLIKSTSTGSKHIIFSTHSASLIESNRIDRIRCVVKYKDKGTTIINEVTNAVDADTILPVKSALAADLPVYLPGNDWTADNIETSTYKKRSSPLENLFTSKPVEAESETAEEIKEEDELPEDDEPEAAEIQPEPIAETAVDVKNEAPVKQKDFTFATNIMKRKLEDKATTQQPQPVEPPAPTPSQPEAPVAEKEPEDSAAQRVRKAVAREREKSKTKRRPLFGWTR